MSKYLDLKEYKNNASYICPNRTCQNRLSLSKQGEEFLADYLYIYWECLSCGTEWVEEYNLISISVKE